MYTPLGRDILDVVHPLREENKFGNWAQGKTDPKTTQFDDANNQRIRNLLGGAPPNSGGSFSGPSGYGGINTPTDLATARFEYQKQKDKQAFDLQMQKWQFQQSVEAEKKAQVSLENTRKAALLGISQQQLDLRKSLTPGELEAQVRAGTVFSQKQASQGFDSYGIPDSWLQHETSYDA